ncbi:MAG: acetyl-CoA C-acyltransferase [Phycisphaerales bacterium]|nr:acetyl-CoA C-acyltransferase [Phycisphaerales bacterium]
MDLHDVYIVSAVRTPIGSFGGALKDVSAIQLGSVVVKEAVQRAGIQSSDVEELIMGCVLQANLGQAPARQVSKNAGLSDAAVCTTINKVCASGLKSIAYGMQAIQLGQASVVIAGGMENMSQAPYYAPQMRWGNKYGHVQFLDSLAKDGLTNVYDGCSMGKIGELCAKKHAIDRQMQDDYCVESYRRSQQAINEGNFKDEIVDITVSQGKQTVAVNQDEEPFKVNFDKLKILKPSFDEQGTITAANSASMNDGAAAVVLMSKERAQKWGIKPLAVIRATADVEQAPEWFTTSPATAITLALKRASIQQSAVDYFEINEAFSVVSIANMKLLNIDHKKLNVHGGSVALGHPLGCSGARILVTLTHLLNQRKGKYGVAGICNGGGGASAMVIESLI